MMPLTVACVWVKGHVPFTVDYVVKLEAMTRRFLDRPFEFVCLTDRSNRVPAHIRTVPIQLTCGLKGWWAKIALFDPALDMAGRVLYLDLDTLIVGELDSIVDYAAPFALAPHAGSFEGKDGKTVVKRFNSSVMVWNGGEQTHLYTDWTPAVAARLWGDQDFIGERCPEATTMPARWFPRLSECLIDATALGHHKPHYLWGSIPPLARVVLCKKPKNVDAATRWTQFQEAWA